MLHAFYFEDSEARYEKTNNIEHILNLTANCRTNCTQVEIGGKHQLAQSICGRALQFLPLPCRKMAALTRDIKRYLLAREFGARGSFENGRFWSCEHVTNLLIIQTLNDTILAYRINIEIRFNLFLLLYKIYAYINR